MDDNPVDAFVHHVADTPGETIPPRARTAVRTFVLDILGVGLAGTRAPRLDALCRVAAGWGRGEDAGAWGLPDGPSSRLPVASAAFLNAYMAHALEFDAIHEPAVVHAMTPVLAAALADAERLSRAGRPCTGRDFAAALALGLDVGCIVGMAARGPMRFFRPATAGAHAAYAALARLRGLDGASVREGFGILHGQIAGTMQAHHEGSMMLGVQMGFAATAAVRAADLAEAGITGPHDVLTGPFGHFTLFEQVHDLPSAMAALGREWQAARLSHKPFPSGRLSHPAIDAMQRLMMRRRFAPEEVRMVEAMLPPLAMRLVGRSPRPDMDANHARLCLPYLLALTIQGGTVGLGDFSPAALADRATHALAARVHTVPDGNPDPNAIAPQAVAVTLSDGTRLKETVALAIGHPDNPLSRERHLAKFRQCAAFADPPLPPDAAERLIELVDGLEDLPDAAVLAAATRPA